MILLEKKREKKQMNESTTEQEIKDLRMNSQWLSSSPLCFNFEIIAFYNSKKKKKHAYLHDGK